MDKQNQQVSLQEQINSIIALISSGQTQEAFDAVEALIKDHPNEPILYNISGACYAGLGQLDNAIISYEKALAIKPDYADAHWHLAGIQEEAGCEEKTRHHLHRFLALAPESPWASLAREQLSKH